MKSFVKFTMYFTLLVGFAIAFLFTALDIEQVIEYINSGSKIALTLIIGYTVYVLLSLVGMCVILSILYLLYKISENAPNLNTQETSINENLSDQETHQ